MERAKASRTAENVAAFRAAHQQLPPERRLVDDPVAARLVSPEGESGDLLRQFMADPSSKAQTQLIGLALRERFTQDRLHDAHSRGVRQYAVIGAGFDTFAYRQPAWARDLRIVEIDQAATQDAKRERLAGAGLPIPPNLRFVPGGLGERALPELLTAGGLDAAQPIFLAMLGVSQYLPRTAFDDTLRAVAALPGGSEIVFSLVLRDDLLDPDEAATIARMREGAAAAGEPFLTQFDPEQLRLDLLGMGFGAVERLSPAAADAAYFGGEGDDRRAPVGQQSISARV